VESCLYEGVVRHRRRSPVEHGFRRRIFMSYLDLDELDVVFRGRWLWSTRRPALVRFRREDHLGDPARPLAQAVRDLVEERRGVRPSGPIRLLTHLRTLGYAFNPVSLLYCFDGAGRHVESIVAEVSNTPWNERHTYVLTPELDRGRGALHRYRTPKEFHVSPFMDMEQDHAWTFRDPGERLSVVIQNRSAVDGRFFSASLSLRRREITGPALARALVRYPLMPLQVIASIYGQALRLRLKGAPVYPHPRERQLASELPSR
jgi:DUF1365 family protein